MDNLVEFWSRCDLSSPPYVHPDDRTILQDQSVLSSNTINNFDSFVTSPIFGAFEDKRLHLSLFPEPYSGSLASADIIICQLNPGLEFCDYFGEYNMPVLRRMRELTIRQDLSRAEFPFMWLDPQFCWHSGFVYWEKKLRSVLRRIAADHFGGAYLKAMRAMSRRIATIELVPYHSLKFGQHRLMERLPSVREMRNYVRNVLEPAARQQEKTLVVTRQRETWGIAEKPGVVVYGRDHARGAHLGPTTLGGQAILRQFYSKNIQ